MIDSIKRLREATSLSIAKIKKALDKSGGDEEKALEILKLESKGAAFKRAGKGTKEGIIDCYIHANGKIGVLVELNCETDFVAKNSEFKELAHNLAMHVAAMNPQYLLIEEVPEEVKKHEREIYLQELKNSDKPQNTIEQIIDGKLKKHYEEISLLTQHYIKDQDITIQDLINNYISKLGENIRIGKFARFEI